MLRVPRSLQNSVYDDRRKGRKELSMIVGGYDPGGAGANGVAVLERHPLGSLSARTQTLASVDEVFAWLDDQRGTKHLAGVGIDTYLTWGTGPSGWRPMDRAMRNMYPSVQQSVFSSNSAAGSMAIQGMAMALRARGAWPQTRLNETHPKILYFALSGEKYSFGAAMTRWLLDAIDTTDVQIANDHEWDALISAWATYLGIAEKWTVDLMNLDSADLIRPAGDVTYWWPEVVA